MVIHFFFFQLHHLFAQVIEKVVKPCWLLLSNKMTVLILELESYFTLYSPINNEIRLKARYESLLLQLLEAFL